MQDAAVRSGTTAEVCSARLSRLCTDSECDVLLLLACPWAFCGLGKLKESGESSYRSQEEGTAGVDVEVGVQDVVDDDLLQVVVDESGKSSAVTSCHVGSRLSLKPSRSVACSATLISLDCAHST